MLSDQDRDILTVTLSDVIADWLTDIEGKYPDFTSDQMAVAAIAVLTGIHNVHAEQEPTT